MMNALILTVLFIFNGFLTTEGFEACDYQGIHLFCEDGYYCCAEHSKCCSYYDDYFGDDTFTISYYPFFVFVVICAAIYKFTTMRHTSIHATSSRNPSLDYTRHFNQNSVDTTRRREGVSDNLVIEARESPDTKVRDSSDTNVRDNRNETVELQDIHIE